MSLNNVKLKSIRFIANHYKRIYYIFPPRDIIAFHWKHNF